MAKKKTNKPVEIDFSTMGDDVGLTLLHDATFSAILDRLPTFFPELDYAIGGGFPFGRMVEIAGKNSAGKSVLTQHAARVAIELGCIVVLIDVEGTADRDRLADLNIDTRKILVKQPNLDKGEALTVESVGKTIETVLETFPDKYPGVPLVFIWDSVGQTLSEAQFNKDFGEKTVGAQANAITQLIGKLAQPLAATKSLFLAINQVRDDIGGNPMYATTKVPGGKAWEHYASLRLVVQKKTAITRGSGQNAEKIGHTMGIKVNKSKVCTPHRTAEIRLLSETGLDYEYNLIETAIVKGWARKIAQSQSYEYVDLNGVMHKDKYDNFLEWMRTSAEGKDTREEILNRWIAEVFPEGYPALKNENLSIGKWLDTVHEVGLQTLAETVSTDDMVSQIQSEIDGDKA